MNHAFGVTSTSRAAQRKPARSLQSTDFGLPWMAPLPSWGKLIPALAEPFFDATNRFRMAHGGDAPFVRDPQLTKSIEWKVLHLAGGQYLAHDDPLKNIGDNPVCPRGWYDRICASGYDGGHPGFQGAAAENLLYGSTEPAAHGYDLSTPALTAQRFVDQLSAAGPDEGHYRNMVANMGAPPAIGVAVALAPNGYLFAGQDLGTTSTIVVAPPEPEKQSKWRVKTNPAAKPVTVIDVVGGKVYAQNRKGQPLQPIALATWFKRYTPA